MIPYLFYLKEILLLNESMYGYSMIKPMYFSTVGADSSLGDDYPEVQISSGLIKGIKMTSFWTNQTFYAFQGVPYAAPPIGDLRFKVTI